MHFLKKVDFFPKIMIEQIVQTFTFFKKTWKHFATLVFLPMCTLKKWRKKTHGRWMLTKTVGLDAFCYYMQQNEVTTTRLKTPSRFGPGYF